MKGRVPKIMSLLVKVIKKKTARGKSNNRYQYMGFDSPSVFDMPYKPKLHRHFILNELRYRTGRPPAFLGKNRKKSERLGKYQRHVPAMWKTAILRNAPLLKGFFEEEPAWREKMLRWCDDALAALAVTETESSRGSK